MSKRRVLEVSQANGANGGDSEPMSSGFNGGAPASVEGIVVRGLTVCLARTRVPVVSDVSFDIPVGEILGLVGESGSGKSTVGLALLAYARAGLEITAGSVRIGDVEMLGGNERRAWKVRGRLVSYVPQDPASSLNPAHRVGPQLREVLMIHREQLGNVEVDERIAELLKEVALPREILRSYPHQMSGGQQQRIAIAMAFACRPRLIVLDEPTTGLDVTTQRHILETIKHLATTFGVSGLYVSHDLPAVGQIASSTAVIYAGRVVEQSETRRLFAQPRHPYTAGLLASAPFPDRSTRLVGVEGHPPRPGRRPAGCSFANRCSRVQDACTAALPTLAPLGSPEHLVRCINPLEGDALAALAAGLPTRATPSTKPSLYLSHVSARYAGEDVVHDVRFEVAAGLCTAIVGESGSGKTTLARCISGLHSRWAGEIRLGEEPLARAARDRTDEQRRLMQFVFQNPFASLNPTMTVAENIEEPLRHFEKLSRGERRRRALDALCSVALDEEFADHLPRRLSGGERQRVAVARALVVGPEILICDEITSALDVSVQALLIEQLRDLQFQRELTMVFITHNLALVRSLAQDVIVLQQGVVVEHGSVDRVLDDPQHEYTRQLIRDIPKMLEQRTDPVAAEGRSVDDAVLRVSDE